ncbi:hypothetical protein AHMF7605_03645 [Adhaeribacter arboris]|uniref:Uncharacterized protein n=1 Tax=Adhaeribacter arboris TaxID=2072846 RepID=A0A2T2YAX0_9BACT|nr:hypothetical protein AHMF7605_03645 [Adhaeribacter arboris]
MCTILVDEIIAGSLAKLELERKAEITCWLDRYFWEKRIAFQKFLTLETIRAIVRQVAFDNLGSQ